MCSVPSQFRCTIGRGTDPMQCVIIILMSDPDHFFNRGGTYCIQCAIKIISTIYRGGLSDAVCHYHIEV